MDELLNQIDYFLNSKKYLLSESIINERLFFKSLRYKNGNKEIKIINIYKNLNVEISDSNFSLNKDIKNLNELKLLISS